MSDTEPNIIKEFRGLYDYVRLMGEHINQIYGRLDTVEKTIQEMAANNQKLSEENIAELTAIKNSMVSKNELNNFIEKLKSSMGETLPPLPDMGKAAGTIQETGER